MDTAPQIETWTGGQDVTPAVLNTFLTDAFNFLGCLTEDKPIFRAYQTVGTVVPTATWTPLGFEDVLEDSAGGWSSAIDAYTAQVPGWYRCTACYCSSGGENYVGQVGFYYVQATSGDTFLWCGDVSTIPDATLGGGAWQVFAFWDFYMETGDTVGVEAYQNSGGTLDNVTNGYGQTSSLEIEWVSN